VVAAEGVTLDTLLQYSGSAFGVACILAVLNWVAVARNWRKAEYVSKPATLIVVIMAAWLITRGPHDAWMARFFLPGLIFSLAGDVFLMLPGRRFFVPGLVSFLLAHVCYIVGLNPTLPPLPALVPLVIVAVIGLLLMRGIASGLRRSGQMALLGPVALYSLVLSLMLFSAWATLNQPNGLPAPRLGHWGPACSLRPIRCWHGTVCGAFAWWSHQSDDHIISPSSRWSLHALCENLLCRIVRSGRRSGFVNPDERGDGGNESLKGCKDGTEICRSENPPGRNSRLEQNRPTVELGSANAHDARRSRCAR
jgi:uncharacterized membrane protein YhhN